MNDKRSRSGCRVASRCRLLPVDLVEHLRRSPGRWPPMAVLGITERGRGAAGPGLSGTNMSIASLVHGRERLSSVATSGSGHGPTIRDERASGCEESPPGVRAETTPRGDDVAHRPELAWEGSGKQVG